jgi:Protein of unknown function with HXXEE motif
MSSNVRSERKQVMDWLVGQWQWPSACLFAAYALLLVTPVWVHVAGMVVTLVMLQLPLYMVHQFEEHSGDRFRTYINKNVAHCEALTPEGAFWINSLGVWGLELVMLYLAVFRSPAYALAAFYLPIVNALTHIREAVARREYNPGLWTSIVLFLPVGGWGLYETSVQLGATWTNHLAGFGLAVAVHVAIIGYILVRVLRLRARATTIR